MSWIPLLFVPPPREFSFPWRRPNNIRHWDERSFDKTVTNRNSVHRYSLPSNNFSSPYRANVGNDSFAGTKHLFNRDNERNVFNAEHRLSTPDIQGYMKMTEPDDKFPTLFRRGGSNIVSLTCSLHSIETNRF